MRILVLTIDAYGGGGGIAEFNRGLLAALAAMPACEEVVQLPRLEAAGAAETPPKLTIVTVGAGGIVRYVLALAGLLLRDRRFDLIVCAHVNLAPFAWVCQVATGAPTLCMLHGIDVWQPHRRRYTNWAVRRMDGFVSISRLTSDKFLSWAQVPEKRVAHIPCCVDLDAFTPGPADPKLVTGYGLAGKKVVMSLSRLPARDRYKGVDEVIEALPGLIDTLPNLMYLIAGDGSDRARLEAKALGLGVAEHTVFTGYVDEAEKVAHYRLADAFALPGRGEGFGIVLLEAMACGIPVVASKLDGSREAVRDGALGILVDPRDPDDLAQGLLAALARPKGTRPEGLEYFSYANFERRLHDIVERAMAAGRV